RTPAQHRADRGVGYFSRSMPSQRPLPGWEPGRSGAVRVGIGRHVRVEGTPAGTSLWPVARFVHLPDDGEGVVLFGLADRGDPGLAVGGAVGTGAAGDGE